ncbi:S-adenosyl-L-methionine-dependent methyltransferase [Rhodocollybia butyracea]|uniref:S-adenosyl-L-methionine-dependent methyltransferase n=1 Tax=Rhodocollybia butyracea TaxID=206335 RepID=A0A9P5PS23_9AGAR|nr:S-adenosyl-L-methionine-dependent methyltransferase [Rhodocollybia butyracea]
MSDQLLDTPSKHSLSFSGLADNAWNRLLEAAFRTGWKPVTKLAEAAVVALMRNMSKGQLKVFTFENIYTFPAHARDPIDGHKAELRVVNDVFWVRLCAMGDLGFAESYMYGDVECDDLVSLFEMFLDNREKLSNMDSAVSYLFTLPQKITSYRFLNTIGNSRSNISAHYDISNEMFAGFLSKDMTYSCAIFDDLDGDLKDDKAGLDRAQWSGGAGLQRLGQSIPLSNQAHTLTGDETDVLESAQFRKLHHIIRKANILPGQRVLEIGSGWGSLSILIAQTVPDTTIHTLTLSVAQQNLAKQRIRDAGLEDRITVHLMDYRDMPKEWEGSFDRMVSVEMIEAVGREFLETYWRQVDWALKDKNAVGVVQVITIPEARFERYIREIDFIRKWVFPGGFLPTLTELLRTLTSGSRGTLTVDSVSNIGPHYARTLREWRKRFLQRFDEVVVPSLQKEYPDVMGYKGADVAQRERAQREIEVFKRKWIYYYCYCEVGFTTRTLGDHIVTFTREGVRDYGCNVLE